MEANTHQNKKCLRNEARGIIKNNMKNLPFANHGLNSQTVTFQKVFIKLDIELRICGFLK